MGVGIPTAARGALLLAYLAFLAVKNLEKTLPSQFNQIPQPPLPKNLGIDPSVVVLKSIKRTAVDYYFALFPLHHIIPSANAGKRMGNLFA